MIRFRIARINIDQFAILTDTLVPENISLNTGVNFMYSIEARRIACKFDLAFNDNDIRLLVMGITCEFEFHPDDWQSFVNTDTVSIPGEILEICVVHTIGTARGILFCKTEGTPFSTLILPPIDVAALKIPPIEEKIS